MKGHTMKNAIYMCWCNNSYVSEQCHLKINRWESGLVRFLFDVLASSHHRLF